MAKKKLTDAEKIKKVHDFFWKSVWGLTIKWGAVGSAVVLGAVEFTRKVKLYDLGVPLFVLDAEPVITSYSYGKTIVLSFILLPCLWLFIWSMEHTMLYKSWWKKSPFAFLFLIGGGFFVIMFYTLLWYVPPAGKTIYATKDYIVNKTGTGVTVAIGDKNYSCRKPMVFTDECSLIEASK